MSEVRRVGQSEPGGEELGVFSRQIDGGTQSDHSVYHTCTKRLALKVCISVDLECSSRPMWTAVRA